MIRLMRPHQWAKSLFVFAGIFFAEGLDDVSLIIQVILAAVAFSLMSSAIYIINDIVDCEKDRRHPTKCHRPLPSNEVSKTSASLLAALLAVLGMGCAFYVGGLVPILIGCYAVLNVAYSFYLKQVILLDVFCIAAGFMLRLLVGTIGVGIPPSNWLLLCGLMLTLFLGFSKRQAELYIPHAKNGDHRDVLQEYSPNLLNQIISICATGVIITYSLYTMSDETIAIHHTKNLITTVPFVTYGLFRYLFLIHRCNQGENPSQDLFKDPHIVISMLSWLSLTSYLFFSK